MIIRVWAFVSPELAVKAASGKSGWQFLDLSDEDLSTLTERQRGVLSEQLGVGQEEPPGSDWEKTLSADKGVFEMDSLRECLQRQVEGEERREREELIKRNGYIERCKEILHEKRSTILGAVFEPAWGLFPNSNVVRDVLREVEAWPEVIEWRMLLLNETEAKKASDDRKKQEKLAAAEDRKKKEEEQVRLH